MRSNNTPGNCICGCGQPAPIATKTRNDRGQVRGQPMKLIPGHRVLGPRISFICKHCGDDFERKPGYVRAKPVRYCSATCREAAKKRRPIVVDNEVTHVPLTKGLTAIIDTADIGLVSGYTWYASHVGDRRHYARTHLSDGRNEYLHRILLGLPNCEVDHIDGNTLNNRRSNLRLATSSQNKANRRGD